MYGVEILGNTSNIHLEPLIKLKINNYISNYFLQISCTHTEILFLDLIILPFKKLALHRIGLEMFKNNLGYVPIAISDIFSSNYAFHNYTKCPQQPQVALCIWH